MTSSTSRGTHPDPPPRSTPLLPGALSGIVRCALDPAYSDAARRRAEDHGGQPGARRPARAASLLTLLATGLLVAAAMHQQALHAPEQARTHAALATAVQEETHGTQVLAAQVSALDDENRAARERERSDAADVAELTKKIDLLAPVAGRAALRGPGVQVRITDASAGPARGGGGPAAGTQPPPDLPGADGRVTDQDIAEVVNALWAAGAEAVAVSGVRLTALTAIRSAGETVLVGFQPLTSPYVVEAVGDPERLTHAVTSSPATARLRAGNTGTSGNLDISSPREITVPPVPVTTPERAGESTP